MEKKYYSVISSVRSVPTTFGNDCSSSRKTVHILTFVFIVSKSQLTKIPNKGHKYVYGIKMDKNINI